MRINTFHRSLTAQGRKFCSDKNVSCEEQVGSNYSSNFILTVNNNNLQPTNNFINSDLARNNATAFQVIGNMTNEQILGIRTSFIDNVYFFELPTVNINFGNNINTDLIKISDNSVHVNGDFSAETVTTSGDINGDNISLVGDIIASNAQITGYVKSQVILSDANIELIPTINHSIDMGNIRYGINLLDTGMINPSTIKANKIFISTTDVLLQSDGTINGIEIIIYNNNSKTNIKIRDETKIISILAAQTSIRLVYINYIVQWIII